MSFGGLYISISGLYANKKALDTISHNISNSNNPIYVRQSAIHASNRYSTTQVGNMQMGTGVHVEEIRQIRDEFIDLRLRREMEIHGYWSATSDVLHEVEMIFNEQTNSGLQKVMSNFWDSWSELYQKPDSITMRGLVHESAVAFVETVNHIDTQLDNLQLNLNKKILNEVDEINNILEDVMFFNEKIKLGEGQGENIRANDFRDSRNELLDKLSEKLPITYYEKYTGEVVISLNGRDLINGNYMNPLKIVKDNKGYGNIYWSDTNEKIDLQGKGELGGYIDARDEAVEKYRKSLNELVKTMADEINEVHKNGKSLDWDGKTNEEIEFFIGSGGEINAANIRVNPELGNFNKIAVSKSGALGDGENIKDILKLRDEINKELKDMTFDNFYRDIISTLGVERNKARSITLNQEILIKQIEDRKGAISAVSLDEEMADMLKYQHSYIANSRVVNAIDEMVENIVNRMGIVGR
ncbi:flagellar hook-associated protein FlgK [Anaerosalibacter sp. Marseille-P3206]|uniref:flagellar hook-associated protein FlgK n=1 Tax=Anaerosalibacter sp. Marseille-P3206 TaxID=1871005 RepID=UPI0009848663|nr:flagellar hook-associated protein FlgK [Anaerosalibacter sp. Marseille-P3206]